MSARNASITWTIVPASLVAVSCPRLPIARFADAISSFDLQLPLSFSQVFFFLVSDSDG